MNSLLGIDLGTTSLKVSIFSQLGKWIASESREHPILIPEAGFAEQDPEAWWESLISSCQALNKKYPEEFRGINGIGLCGQRHTQVYLDEEFRNLRPAIT